LTRRPRETGKYFHIIVRGIGKQIIFEDASDREIYIGYLKKYAGETDVSIIAYCLMENHVHILALDSQGSVSVFMKKMGVSYAQYYNRKYERTGHLFQDRFKSETITDVAHLLSAYRYILNNPVKAGICRAEEYPWSSFNEYGKENGLTDTGMLRRMIGDEAEFNRFMQICDDAEHIEDEKPKRDDAWALEILKKELNISSGTMLQQMGREQRDEALARLKRKGLSVRQLERLTGINRGVIQKAKEKVVK